MDGQTINDPTLIDMTDDRFNELQQLLGVYRGYALQLQKLRVQSKIAYTEKTTRGRIARELAETELRMAKMWIRIRELNNEIMGEGLLQKAA